MLFIQSNFIYLHVFPAGPLTYLQNIKYRMAKTRYVTYAFVSLWKILLFFGMMVLLSYFRLDDLNSLFRDINPSFSNHTLIVNEVKQYPCIYVLTGKL